MRQPTSTRGAFHPWVMGALIGVMAAAAACGDAGVADPGSSATAGQGPSQLAPTAEPGGSTRPADPAPSSAEALSDACGLLSDADILELAGVGVASKDPAPVAYAQSCSWTLEGGGWEITLGVDPSGGVAAYDRLVEFNGGGVELPGLGDRAIRLDITNSPIAQLGAALYDLQFTGVGEPADLDVRLLERVLANASAAS